MFIMRTEGDPVKLQEIYHDYYTELAGQPGRGEDWGIPLVVLRHICAFDSRGMYIIDVFKDEETLHNLLFNPGNLPDHLRPVNVGSPSMWARMGVEMPQKRWERDVEVLHVGKILPPLQSVQSDLGGDRRPRV